MNDQVKDRYLADLYTLKRGIKAKQSVVSVGLPPPAPPVEDGIKEDKQPPPPPAVKVLNPSFPLIAGFHMEFVFGNACYVPDGFAVNKLVFNCIQSNYDRMGITYRELSSCLPLSPADVAQGPSMEFLNQTLGMLPVPDIIGRLSLPNQQVKTSYAVLWYYTAGHWAFGTDNFYVWVSSSTLTNVSKWIVSLVGQTRSWWFGQWDPERWGENELYNAVRWYDGDAVLFPMRQSLKLLKSNGRLTKIFKLSDGTTRSEIV